MTRTMTSPLLLWFKQDLRLTDHPALLAACATGQPVLPFFILEEGGDTRPLGGASRWWLHHSLQSLQQDLVRYGVRLILKRGKADKIIDELISETGASGVFWSRCLDPASLKRDNAIQTSLRARNLSAENFNSALLFEPWQIKTKTGTPYQVFTPYWKACLAAPPPAPAEAAPQKIRAYEGASGLELEELELLPQKPDWAQGLREEWQPGEAGAQARLRHFLFGAITGYKTNRDFPAQSGTSRLSPHLHWGEISVRQLWHALMPLTFSAPEGATHFLRELGWREFAHHLLFHFPAMETRPLNRRFENFLWLEDESGLKRWQQGKTGIPIVDAGLRELWHTGWMHNRVRMIVGSYLVKDLLISWRQGEAWFWDTLVDADVANNSCGWQWIAGCGADAAPYFRVFNPVLQGQKFDPAGAYVRRWCPELAALPDKYIHAPWQAPPEVLQAANLTLGSTYPLPMIDHKSARTRALQALQNNMS
jgi:deoxyribodipyrimidine photo-lyase